MLRELSGSLGGIFAVTGPDPRIFTDLQAPFHFLSRWRPISGGRHLNNPGHVFESPLGCPEAETYYTGPERRFSCTTFTQKLFAACSKSLVEIRFRTSEPGCSRCFNSPFVSSVALKSGGFEPNVGGGYLPGEFD